MVICKQGASGSSWQSASMHASTVGCRRHKDVMVNGYSNIQTKCTGTAEPITGFLFDSNFTLNPTSSMSCNCWTQNKYKSSLRDTLNYMFAQIPSKIWPKVAYRDRKIQLVCARIIKTKGSRYSEISSK